MGRSPRRRRRDGDAIPAGSGRALRRSQAGHVVEPSRRASGNGVIPPTATSPRRGTPSGRPGFVTGTVPRFGTFGGAGSRPMAAPRRATMVTCRTSPSRGRARCPGRAAGDASCRSTRRCPRPSSSRTSSRPPASAGSTSSRPGRPIATGSRTTSTSTRSTTRTSTRATTGRSSTSTTTTSSSSCTSRCSRRTTARILTAELDLFMGPDYLITLPNIPLPPLTAMFERYREKADLRETTFSKGSGYLLYKIVDTCVDASFPMLRKMGSSSTASRTTSSRAARPRSCATSPRPSRRSSTSGGSSGRSAPCCATSSGRSSATSRKSSRSTSTTSPTPPSGSGTPSRTTRRSSRRSSRPTNRCCRTG